MPDQVVHPPSEARLFVIDKKTTGLCLRRSCAAAAATAALGANVFGRRIGNRQSYHSHCSRIAPIS